MSDALLEEYKALRDEIKRNEGQGIQVILLLVTGVLSYLGLKSPPSIPLWLLALLLQITLLIGFAQYLDSLRLRIRLSKYIQVFLENAVDDLNWETRQSSFSREERDSFSDKIGRPLYHIALNVFTFLFVGASGLSWKVFYDWYKGSETPCLCCLIFIFIVLVVLNVSLLYLTILIVRDRYHKEHDKSYDKSCLRQWTKMKENEKSS